jgi:hypothetical protein
MENLLNTKPEYCPQYHSVWLFNKLFPDDCEWQVIMNEAVVTAYFTVLFHAYGMVEDFQSEFSCDNGMQLGMK